MITTLRSLPLAAALLLIVGTAHAIEFRSVSEPAVLFDTPSDKGKPLFIITPGTPVEVVVTLDKWVKVRDAGGAITWINGAALSAHRTVMITSPNAVVRQRPDHAAPPAFEAVKDVVLDLAAPPAAGWVEVRHQDGSSGYIRVTEVWGL